jgi:hypothetical protein
LFRGYFKLRITAAIARRLALLFGMGYTFSEGLGTASPALVKLGTLPKRGDPNAGL